MKSRTRRYDVAGLCEVTVLCSSGWLDVMKRHGQDGLVVATGRMEVSKVVVQTRFPARRGLKIFRVLSHWDP